MTELSTLLQEAFSNGRIVTGTEQIYTVSAPIVINVTRDMQGPVGIDLGGAIIKSQITSGSPIIQINVAAGVDLANLNLSNFAIYGSGSEGDGIRIVVDGTDRSLRDWLIRDVTIQHVGGAGLDMVGNIKSGTVFNSWMHDNGNGGARFDNGVQGGVVSDVEWAGGGFRKNDVGGLVLDHGAQGVSVNGAYFVENSGPGVIAPSGITTVTASGFENNVGTAIEFNGHGDFWANTFSSFGPQTLGIGGTLSGAASLLGNISEYYGPGSGSLPFASLQGNGNLSDVGGGVSFGGGVDVSGPGNLPSGVVVTKFDFVMPSVAPVTQAMSAPVADSRSGQELETVLRDALLGDHVANLAPKTYVVTSPIVINLDGSSPDPKGIDLGGATIVSQITNGAPVIQINVGPNVDLRYLTLSNFTIQGNGQEGDGIKIVAAGPDRWLYNWTVSDVTVKDVGGIGLDVIGSVFEGMVANSWMTGNAGGGARFAHSAQEGQASALRWYGGGAQDNGVAGIVLSNGARDLTIDGADISGNHGPGVMAPYGITAVMDSRFRDNQDVGVVFQNYGNFINNEFITSGSQTYGVEAWLNNPATLINNTSTYTGTGTDPTALANLQGVAQLGIYGNEKVIVGPSLDVIGLNGAIHPHPTGYQPAAGPVVQPPVDVPSPGNGGVSGGGAIPGSGSSPDLPGNDPSTDLPGNGAANGGSTGNPDPGSGSGTGGGSSDGGTSAGSGDGSTGNHIDLGAGNEVLHDSLAELHGSVISGFGRADTIDIGGALIGRDSLGITKLTDGVMISAGGSNFQLNGSFTDGDFMAVARGTGASAHTLVTFENYLPHLQEGIGVDPASINGVGNQPFLTGDNTVRFSVELKGAVSDYSNTLGTYRMAEDGAISDVHIVFSNTRAVAAGTTVDLGVPSGNQKIGFFLIQDGYDIYGNLPDNLSFGPAGGVTGSQVPVLQSATLGQLNGATVFHSFSSLNPAQAEYVLTGTSPGGREMLMGFEDQLHAIGDHDFQDVVISVKTDKDGLLIV